MTISIPRIFKCALCLSLFSPLSALSTASTGTSKLSPRYASELVHYAKFSANNRTYDLSYVTIWSDNCQDGHSLDKVQSLFDGTVERCNGTTQGGGMAVELSRGGNRDTLDLLVVTGSYLSDCGQDMIHTDLIDPSDPMQRCIANISSPVVGGLVQIDNGIRPPDPDQEKPFDILIFGMQWLAWAILQFWRLIFWVILGGIAFSLGYGALQVVNWCVAYWTGRTGWIESVAKWLQSVGDSCTGSVSGMKQTFKEWWQNRGRQQGDYDGVPVEMDEQETSDQTNRSNSMV